MADPTRTRSGGRPLRACFLGTALAVVGCRFGADPSDPFADIPASASAAGAGGATGSGGATDSVGVAADNGTTGMGGATAIGAAGSSATAAGGSAASNGGAPATAAGGSGGARAMPASDGGSSRAGGGCQPTQLPAVCDPVKNVGCLVPFSSCDVDPTQAVPAGRCVFPFTSTPPGPDAGACQVNATTETCLPMSTCVNGGCRKLCYCDSDCLAGECCTEVAPGPSGIFKLCGRC